MSVLGVILVRIFPHSDWIRRDTAVIKIYCYIWNFKISKFHAEQENFRLGSKMNFWVNLGKNLKKIEISTFEFAKCKVSCKPKNFALGPKKRLIWVFLRQNLEKQLSYLKSTTSNFFNLQSFVIIKKKFGTKNALFWYF